MKRTPHPGRFFPLRRRHVPVPPDRRPRTISVTLEIRDQRTNYADDARRLFDVGPGTRGGHMEASYLLGYARRHPGCRVTMFPDGTATITVTRTPRISTKQKI